MLKKKIIPYWWGDTGFFIEVDRMFALSWRELNEVTMQIGTCLNTSFLLPSSNSGGGANEKRRGTEVRREEEKGKKKTSELPSRAYARFAFYHPPDFLQSLYWIFFLFLQHCFMSWLFFGCEACGILAPQLGIKLVPHTLESEAITTGPPGKFPTHLQFFLKKLSVQFSLVAQ